jgi:DNA-binding GntR family transcriptional regulator
MSVPSSNPTIIPLTNGRTLADHVASQLTAAIIEGRLPQGSKIVEEDLAAEYGISRGPLREAIRRLEGNKLLVRIPHAGVRVVKLDAAMMREIYVVRESLEGMSARLAASHMSAEEIASLRQLLEQHERDILGSEGRNYFQEEGDLDFHFRIAEGSHNQWLIQLLSGELYQLIRMCRRCSGAIPSRPAVALDEHRHIVEAIARRDGELAEILMRRHISAAAALVEQKLSGESS